MSATTTVTLILLVALLWLALWFFNGKKVMLRTLGKLPATPVKQLQDHVFGKVSGKALHVKEPLIAPFSERKCVFYSVKIEKRVSSGKRSHWKTLVDDEQIQEFFVDAGDDFVIVQPNKSQKNYISHLVVDKTQRSGTFNDPTPQFQRVLNRYSIESENFFGWNRTLRYSEGIIEVGENITVAGIVKWKQLKTPIAEYPHSKIVCLVATDKQKLIITDLPEATYQN